MADCAASFCLNQQILSPSLEHPQFVPLPTIKCYLRIDNHFVTSHERKCLLWHIGEKSAQQYYLK